MGYADLLKNPQWQKKRLEVLEASGWECEMCGDKTTTKVDAYKLWTDFINTTESHRRIE
jgi:hypothetical protein